MNKQTLRQAIIVGLFLIPFVPFLVSSSFFFPFITTKVFAWRAIVELIFAAWLILILLDPKYLPKKSPLLYTMLAFLVVVGLADLFGANPVRSFWSNFERMEGFVTLLHLGALFLVAGSVFEEADWRRWWKTSLAASFLMVLYCLLQLAGLKTINQGGVRVDGTFGNAIYLAVYMLFHIFIALFYMVREWKNKTARSLYGILIILQAGALYYTATRGAILGLLGGLIILALLNIRNREQAFVRKGSIALVGGVILVIGSFFLIRNTAFVRQSPVLSRFADLSLGDIKTQGRSFVWPMAWQGIKERPILGWGEENFPLVFQEHYSAEMYSLEPWFDRAHNIFLDWAVSGGFLALALYLALYAVLLRGIWRDAQFSHVEKSILTALIAAYFFHNIFVFDNLVSYTLFFSLLAFVSSRSETRFAKPALGQTAVFVGVPAVVIGLLLSLYFVEVKPLRANHSLIVALNALQANDGLSASKNFEKAYSTEGYLGRSEIIEQAAENTVSVLQSSISMDEKNHFYTFVRTAVLGEADAHAHEARPQLVAGSFLSAVGSINESLMYLGRAKQLMPAKQEVYFEIGSAYINAKQYDKALQAFAEAYQMAPGFEEAKLIYLIGAIYARNAVIEHQMLSELDERTVVFDDRTVNAYYANGRIADVRHLLERRKALDPKNAAVYDNYLKQLEGK